VDSVANTGPGDAFSNAGAPTGPSGSPGSGLADGGAPSNIVQTGTEVAPAVNAGPSMFQQNASPYVQGTGEAIGVGAAPGDATGSIVSRFDSPVQSSFLDTFKKVGSILKENKELVDLGGGMLKGAFGPEARKWNLYEQQLQMEKEELDRRNRNSNNLVGLRNPITFYPNAPAVRRS
jgi:hypothetical protein